MKHMFLASAIGLAGIHAAFAAEKQAREPEDQQTRLAVQARHMAAKEGWICGMRAVELIRPFDAATADRYLAAARKAFTYAAARDPEAVWREHSTNETQQEIIARTRR